MFNMNVYTLLVFDQPFVFALADKIKSSLLTINRQFHFSVTDSYLFCKQKT